MSRESTTNTTIHLHVATTGNDSWSGALPESNAAGTDGPFATLRRARDAVRAAIKAGRAAQAAWEAELRVRTVELPVVWSFRRDPADAGEAAGWFASDPDDAWTELRTDKSWTEQGHDYHGVAWYSVAFTVPAAARAGRHYRLCFGAVDGCCRVWLDGREIGAQLRPPEEMWNKPFEFDVGGALASDRNHRLVVRVVKDRRAAGIWKPVRFEPVAQAAPPSPRPVTVLVRGGKYYLDETLVLGPEDSGTPDCPVTWEAYPGETPMLSGGRRIAGWKPYRDGILQCSLPEAKGGKWRFRQLFFNGQRQIRSRYPKLDPANPIYGGWLFTKSRGSTVSFRYAPDALTRRWKKPTEAEVYMYTGISNTIPIKAMDEENRVITLAHATKDFKRLPYARFPVHIGENAPFYVENILEELSQPGEWCLDGEDGVLYFWPPAPMEGAEVVVPVLDCLIDLNGASWVTVSGFTFTETTYGGDNMHREGNEGYGAFSPGAGGGREYCGEALHMSGAEHCRIENNRFYAVGGNAIYVEGRNTRNIIGNNEISHAGANGICLIGTRYFQSLMVGPLRSVRLYPIYNQVEHNHIHHCGVFDQCIAGVFLGLSDSNVIGHNLIEHMPHHGINLGNSQYGRNVVEYNEIRHTCLRTSDNGAINVWGEDPEGHIQKDVERSGHVIRYNLIVDTHGWHLNDKGVLAPSVWLKEATEAATHGIYLDNFASNCFVCGNILVRSGSTGIYIQGGKNNIVENNIVVDVGNLSHLGGWWQPQMGEPSFMTGNRFCRNIFYRTHGNPPVIFRHIGYRTEPLSDAIGWSDYNLFFSQVSGAFTITESTSFLFPELPTEWPKIKVIRLEEWQKEGFDTHSLIADPRFVDPAAGDYRLRPDSPALALGFVPIPVERIGIRKGEAR